MNEFLYASASMAIVLGLYLASGPGLPKTSLRLLAAAMFTVALHNLLSLLQIGDAKHELIMLRPGLAVVLPALLYLHVAVAARARRELTWQDSLHLAGPLAVTILRIAPPGGLLLDVSIILLNVFYLGLTAWASRNGTASFSGLGASLAALFDRWRRLVLIFMASVILLDIGILVGLGTQSDPADYEWIFGLTGLFLMLGFAYLLVTGLHRTGPLKWAGERHRVPHPEQADLVDRLESALHESRDYLDPNLTLQRLARRSGLPTRSISAAINDRRNCNYNQWLNGFRIEEAQKVMREEQHIGMTDVMFRAGFQNKSTFNAAFRSIVGCSPSAWRDDLAQRGKSVQD